MRIGTVVTELPPQTMGRGLTEMPELRPIMEKANLLGPDQWLIVEPDDDKERDRLCNALRKRTYAAFLRKGIIYVGREGTYTPMQRNRNGSTPSA